METLSCDLFSECLDNPWPEASKCKVPCDETQDTSEPKTLWDELEVLLVDLEDELELWEEPETLWEEPEMLQDEFWDILCGFC